MRHNLLSTIIMKQFIFTILITIVVSLTVAAQELPQFIYPSYAEWIYNGKPVTADDFQRGAAIYVNSQDQALMLISPYFSCQGIDSIAATIKWRSESSEIGLTIAIDDGLDSPLDSIHVMPLSSGIMQTLHGTIAVPVGVMTARLRFVSWDANNSNGGTIRTVQLQAITGTTPPDDPAVKGDVDGNGKVDIADVTALIDNLLADSASADPSVADLDGDGKVTISDVTALIDKLLSGNH